jgi:hypothetical protein
MERRACDIRCGAGADAIGRGRDMAVEDWGSMDEEVRCCC